MAATYGAGAGTLSSILKEFYLGSIQETLNQETLVVELMEKASVDWNGRHVFIPVHVGRNADVGFVGEGQAMPGAPVAAPVGAGAPQQFYANLIVTAAFLYGKFAITGPAIAAAGKGSANSFVGYVDAEMTRLKDDVRNRSNRAATSGRRVKGFISTHGVAGPILAGAATTVLFDGDIQAAADIQTAVLAGNGSFLVRRLDTYADSNAGTVWEITDVPTTVQLHAVPGGLPAGQIELTVRGLAAAAGFPTTQGPAGQFLPLALEADPTVAGAIAITDVEPSGIYSNLASGVHFGLNRALVANATLRAQFLTTTTAAAPLARTAMSLDRHFQAVTDIIALAANGSEEAPDYLLVNPAQRSRMAALLVGNIAMDTSSRTTGVKGDGGFTGFSYAGVPVKVSRHVDNGLVIHLSTKTWKMCELSSAEFADLDGSVLSRVANADAWEGFMKWYYDCVCTRPGANAIVTGLAL